MKLKVGFELLEPIAILLFVSKNIEFLPLKTELRQREGMNIPLEGF